MVLMIFKPAARYPADPRAVFILALSVFSGITTLALKAAPESLEAVLPNWGVIVWSVMLTLGSILTLTGMVFQSLNGIILEQVGSVIVGATTVFYSGLALWVIGPTAFQTVSIILAWGVACFVRWIQLQVLIHNALKRQAKMVLLERVNQEIEARERREHAERVAHARHDH
jgi:hypothetical protein